MWAFPPSKPLLRSHGHFGHHFQTYAHPRDEYPLSSASCVKWCQTCLRSVRAAACALGAPPPARPVRISDAPLARVFDPQTGPTPFGFADRVSKVVSDCQAKNPGDRVLD